MPLQENKYYKKLRGSLQDDCLILRPPRYEWGFALGLLVYVLLLVHALAWPQSGRVWGWIQAPWFGLPCGIGIFYAVSRVFRDRIVLDRARNQAYQGRHPVRRLDQIECVKLETAFRSFAMNSMSLVFSEGLPMKILVYDGTPKTELREFSDSLAEFLKVPERTS